MWSFETEPEFQEKLEWMRTFVQHEVIPLEVLDPASNEFDARLVPLQQQVRDAGLWAAHLDPELGGQGFGQVKLGLMHEVIGRCVHAPVVFGNQAPDSGNSEILARHGTTAQKDRYLRPLLAGAARSAYAMTEPAAGADPTLLQTTASESDGGWRLVGDKWFITNAGIADFFIVMAVTDPDEKPHRRASQFIVERDNPGLRVGRALSTLDHFQPDPDQEDVHFELHLDAALPEDAMLGPRGTGFLIAQERLGPGRIHHCMRWVGQASRALDMLAEYALSRYTHGSLLAEKQTVQNWIADSWAELHGLRLMTLHAAWRIDRDGASAVRKEISAIKFLGARILHDVVDKALQAHGALGYSDDLPLADMYRRARAARIYDGPDEVHRQVVARQVLKEYSAPPDGRPTEHYTTRRERLEPALSPPAGRFSRTATRS